jgi:hypothetical protein
MTVQEIYDHAIKPLSTQDRLKIASFILKDIADNNLDVSDEWNDEDLIDFTAASWKQTDNALTESKDA